MLNPFLKWPGGKRWFIERYSHVFPTRYNRYIEPFLGSGSVYFYLQPKRALLGDLNPELISAYLGIKEDWFKVESLLEKHEANHCNAYYYMIRDSRPTKCIYQAARLIYLNRTCFNGIYRVNKEGKFNVPKGTRSSVIFDTDDFEQISQALQNARLSVTDFEILLKEARRDDVVFADPPYTVSHNVNGFIKYNETLFSWADQKRLAYFLAKARDKGAKIISTNANHESVRNLYKLADFTLKTVSRFSCVSAAAHSRKEFEELLILSEPTCLA